jgi:hypothetical protein
MSDDIEELHELIEKNFKAKRPGFTPSRHCGAHCGPCWCPGGSTCTPSVGTSTETVGYSGGVAGDMPV